MFTSFVGLLLTAILACCGVLLVRRRVHAKALPVLRRVR